MLNKEGYRYLQDYDLGKPQPQPVLRSMELGPRDRLSQAFVKEVEKGRTLKGEYGDYVHLDLRHLGAKIINTKLPFVRELCLKYQNIDPIKELIPVRPVVHYMMGGVDTNVDGATPIRGLYAAGECACVSINGANRLGSNSLTEILVFGARAARSAVAFAADKSINKSAIEQQATDEQKRIVARFFRPAAGAESIAGIRVELQKAMEDGAGIYRTEESLKSTCEKVEELKERYHKVEIADHSVSFNTELTTAIELGFLL